MNNTTYDGTSTSTPCYKAWSSMISRCYNKKLHKRFPTYKDCYVSEDWLTYSNFQKWYDEQGDVSNMTLDKDILLPANKEYSPATCCYVSHELNSLLTTTAARRGRYPIGVSWDKTRGKFQATIKRYGKNSKLGRFTTEQEASDVYRKAKAEHIQEVAMSQSDDRIKQGLLLHSQTYH